jgi:hypothetical protein
VSPCYRVGNNYGLELVPGFPLNWPRSKPGLARFFDICAWQGGVVEALWNRNQAAFGPEADNLMHDFYSRLERRESGRRGA